MLFARPPFAQYLLSNSLGLCQLALQLLQEADGGVSGEDPCETDIVCGDVNIHPVVPPYGCRLGIDVKRGGNGHSDSIGKLIEISCCQYGSVKSVANVATTQSSSNNRIPTPLSVRIEPVSTALIALCPVASGQGGASLNSRITARMRASVNRVAVGRAPTCAPFTDAESRQARSINSVSPIVPPAHSWTSPLSAPRNADDRHCCRLPDLTGRGVGRRFFNRQSVSHCRPSHAASMPRVRLGVTMSNLRNAA